MCKSNFLIIYFLVENCSLLSPISALSLPHNLSTHCINFIWQIVNYLYTRNIFTLILHTPHQFKHSFSIQKLIEKHEHWTLNILTWKMHNYTTYWRRCNDTPFELNWDEWNRWQQSFKDSWEISLGQQQHPKSTLQRYSLFLFQILFTCQKSFQHIAVIEADVYYHRSLNTTEFVSLFYTNRTCQWINLTKNWN